MKHRIGSGERHPLRALYNEAGLPQDIRRSLNFILFGNLCGNLWGIICGGGTTAMVGLATSLGADDFTFAVLNAIPQIAALTQIPFSMRVNRTHKRKKYLLKLRIPNLMKKGRAKIPPHPSQLPPGSSCGIYRQTPH